MVKIIKHKVNKLPKQLEKSDMIEVDVRDYDGNPCIGHDPLKTHEEPQPLFFYLKQAQLLNIKLLAVNIKSDGNEEKIINLLNRTKIPYFVFDMSRPSYHRYKQNTNNIALPVSEYDSVEGLKHLSDNPRWVWLDCFNGDIDKQFIQYEKLKYKYGNELKVVFVSPDLHGNREQNKKLFKLINNTDENLYVCTDYMDDYK